MQRYFIEVGYKGTNYAGFQIQQNANTIQEEIEKAFKVYLRKEVSLTGSSRTDAGVHARQNFFHSDFEEPIEDTSKARYHINAILPKDIVIHNIYDVDSHAHCRFDALSRTYIYTLVNFKDPFHLDDAYYFPFPIDEKAIKEAAEILLSQNDFEIFSKKNTQVFTHQCTLYKSEWTFDKNIIQYTVEGNRFLRGMVRALVGTMLQVGRGKISIDEFKLMLNNKQFERVDFSAPAHGLMLNRVTFSNK